VKIDATGAGLTRERWNRVVDVAIWLRVLDRARVWTMAQAWSMVARSLRGRPS